MNRDRELAEQLLAAKGERPKEHVLKTPKKPTVKKNKAKTQRKAIEHDFRKIVSSGSVSTRPMWQSLTVSLLLLPPS